MVALAKSNHQHLKDLQNKLAQLKSHIVGRGPMRQILETKLRELEAEQRLLERRTYRVDAARPA